MHGESEAIKARNTSEEVFSKGYSEEGMPECEIEYTEGMNLMDLLVSIKIAPSKSEARRLITGNGISLNNNKESDPNRLISKEEINNLIVSKGKKTHIKVNLVK